MTLRQRILLWVLLLVSVAVLVTIGVSTWNGRQILLDRTEAHGVLIASLLARNASFVQHIPSEAEHVIAEQMLAQATLAAHLVAIAETAGLDSATINQHLQKMTATSVIDEFWITDALGHAYLRSLTAVDFTFSPDPNQQPQAYIFWPLLTQQATQVVQEARQREIDDDIFKYVGVTGVDQPRIVQVGYNAVYLENLRTQLGMEGMMQQVLATGMVNAVHVVNLDLELLAKAEIEADNEWIALDNGDSVLAQTVLQRQVPEYYYVDEHLKVAAPMFDSSGSVSGVVFVSLPLNPVNQALLEQIQAAIWISLIILLLSVIAVWLLSRQLSLPLLSLSDAVRGMAYNDWQQVKLTSHTAEIANLATAFNYMGQQLQLSFAALEKSNAELEARVVQRTSALQAANQQISNLNERLQAENLRMSTELEVARQLQQMVLPRPEEFKAIEELDIAGFMQPADEVGGDYYDILRHDGRIKIGIGDVTGHGLESGVLMLMVQTAVRTLLSNNVTDPQAFMNILNKVIYANVQRMGSDKNLTLLLLDYQNGCLKISGQHEEMLVVRQNGDIERVSTFELGFVVGLEEDITDWVNQQEIYLQPGDGVVLYTDGVTEAMNSARGFFRIEQLCEIVKKNWNSSAHTIQQAVIQAVHEHMGANKPLDDITLVVIKQNVTPQQAA